MEEEMVPVYGGGNGSGLWRRKWFWSMEEEMVLVYGGGNGSGLWRRKWFRSMEEEMVLVYQCIPASQLVQNHLA